MERDIEAQLKAIAQLEAEGYHIVAKHADASVDLCDSTHGRGNWATVSNTGIVSLEDN